MGDSAPGRHVKYSLKRYENIQKTNKKTTFGNLGRWSMAGKFSRE